MLTDDCTQNIHSPHLIRLTRYQLFSSSALQLFLIKWRAVNPEFVQYSKNQWVKKNSKWYEGTAVQLPSTNNGLEATNMVIKSENTLRARLPVGKFLNGVTALLVKWSKNRVLNSVNWPYAVGYTTFLHQ